MDDPWGSPWAEDTRFQPPKDEKQKEDSRSTAEVPAPSATSSLGITTSSPWGEDGGDDDDFGEWSSVPTIAKTSAAGNSFETEWSLHDGQTGSVDHEELSPGWDRNEAVISRDFESNEVAGNSVDQPSPDPWTDGVGDVIKHIQAQDGPLRVPDVIEEDHTHRVEEAAGSSVSSHASSYVVASEAREFEAGESYSSTRRMGSCPSTFKE